MNLGIEQPSDFAERSYDQIFYFITNSIERLETNESNLEDMLGDIYWTYGARQNKGLYRQAQKIISYLQRSISQYKRDLQRVNNEMEKHLNPAAS